MTWLNISRPTPEHRCSPPTEHEIAVQDAHWGSRWQCDECHQIWRLVGGYQVYRHHWVGNECVDSLGTWWQPEWRL